MEIGQQPEPSVTRAHSVEAGETSIRAADLELRPTSRQILRDGQRAQLTGRELDVIMILLDQPDRVVTRESIYREVWGGQMPYRDRAVDVYVRRVREKLRSISPDVAYIHTHFGIGYRFWPEKADAVEASQAVG